MYLLIRAGGNIVYYPFVKSHALFAKLRKLAYYGLVAKLGRVQLIFACTLKAFRLVGRHALVHKGSALGQGAKVLKPFAYGFEYGWQLLAAHIVKGILAIAIIVHNADNEAPARKHAVLRCIHAAAGYVVVF